jgi:hypothetical protein
MSNFIPSPPKADQQGQIRRIHTVGVAMESNE